MGNALDIMKLNLCMTHQPLDTPPMPTVRFVSHEGTLDIDDTSTLREAAHVMSVNVHDQCGGMGACCSCIVNVVEGMENINEKTVVEQAVFYLQPNQRLSCQCRISGDVLLEVPS